MIEKVVNRHWMRFRALLVVVLAPVFVLIAMFAFVPQAQAAGCYGSSCEGKDPQDQGCSADAKNLTEITGPYGRYQMRYSPTCDAVWTRIVRDSGSGPSLGAWLMISSFTCSSGTTSCWKRSYQWPVPIRAGATGWTDMMYFRGQWLRSCYNFTSDPRPVISQCTGVR